MPVNSVRHLFQKILILYNIGYVLSYSISVETCALAWSRIPACRLGDYVSDVRGCE